MTLKERLEQDGVGMRWFRTAATTLTSITAALLVIWGGLLWLVEPRLHQWAKNMVDMSTQDLRDRMERTDDAVDRVEALINSLERNVIALSEVTIQSTDPAWKFDHIQTSISDGPIGGLVRITAVGYKLRDCGIPIIDMYFINGGGLAHRFADVSIESAGGRGILLPTDPTRLQTISYAARIPNNEGISPGRGIGYISLTYSDSCPAVDPVVAGPLQFQILPSP